MPKNHEAKNCLRLGLALALMLSANSGYAKEPDLIPFPTTREGNYAVAQKFAHCGAHFAFVALIAKSNDKNDAASAFEDQARGWKLAGMFFLAEAMAEDRKADTERTFDILVEAKVSQLKALHEVDSASSGSNFTDEFNENCLPLRPTQRKLIELFRRG
ncbi:MAG: hypothetical protein ACK44T_13320 [Sphingomonadales bacterium]|jgi:hypothetical protein